MDGNPFATFPSTASLINLGRDNLLEEIAQIITLSRPDHKDFHGLPEMGKSSLLRYVAQPEFLDKFGYAFMGDFKNNPHRLFIIYLSGWIESIHPLVIFSREFYRNYKKYRERMSVEHDWELPELDEPSLADDDGDRALEIMEPHIRQLVEAGVRPVFLFDDFDRDHAFGKLSVPQAGRLSTWMSYCSFIFATERLLEEVNPSAKKGSPLFKRLPQTAVREFIPEEAVWFLEQILEGAGIDLPDEDIDFLVEQTGGFPHHLLLAGRALWDLRRRMGLLTERGDDKPLPTGARSVLANRLAVEFNRSFNSYFQALKPEQCEALIELAQEEQEQNETPRQSGMEMSRRDILLSALEQYGLVRIDDNGQMHVFSPLFRDFLLAQEALQPHSEAEVESELTEQQAVLYKTFRNRPDQVLTFGELGRQVWRWSVDYDENIDEDDKRKIRIAVSKLRRQLDEAATGERIVSLRSKGYRFEPAR
jgi:hypothetical protein